MGKVKTHRASAKRFSVTGTGKVKIFHSSHRHNLGKKPSKRKRNLRSSAILSEAMTANVRALIKGAMMTRKRRNKVLKAAKGYWGSKSKHFKMAKEAVMKSGNYAFAGRRRKKRDFRRLWITRISAGCKTNGMNYSSFMNGLKKAGVTLNRKMLSEIAIADPAAFTALCEQAKAAL